MASWLAFAAAAACLIVALSWIRSSEPKQWVEVSLDGYQLQPWRDGYYGIVEQELPNFRLSWDGTPPRAEIVDTRTGEILAPPVFGRSSLEANRNAVLWLGADAEQLNPERCEFVIETRYVRERGPFLALRLELPPSAKTFHRATLLAVVLIGAALAMRGTAQVTGAAPTVRLAVLARCCRAGLFLLLAAASFAAHYPGVPWFHPETDAASINSFAAALDNPGAFERDALLDQQSDFDWYTPVFVTLIRGVARLGFPYHSAYAALGFLGTWLSLTGYARLFSKTSRSALFGTVSSLALVLLSASYPPDEHWSFSTVLPRSLFSALLPWVLLLALRWTGPRPAPSPRRWWIAAAAAATLFYIHPVSSPALSGALLVGYVVVGGVRLRERLVGIATATAATVLVMLPYALRYGAARQAAEVGSEGLRVLRATLGPFEPQRFYPEAFDMLVSTPRYWVLVVGLMVLLFARRPGWRIFFGLFVGWVAATLVLPAIDWTLAERWGRQPFQVNLVRNLRYLDLWLLATLAVLARSYRHGPFRSLWLSARLTAGRAIAAARSRLAGAALVASAIVILLYAPPSVRTLRSIATQVEVSRAALLGRWRTVPSARLEVLLAIQAFRGEQESVVTPPDLDFFRQLLIPLAYTWKDPGVLSYAAGGEMVRAKRVVLRVQELLEPPVEPVDAHAISVETGAALLVIERWRTSLALRESPSRLFLNDRYVLVRPALGSETTASAER